MFNNWLRTNKMAMYMLTIIRVYLGYQWMHHGWDKLTTGFDAAGFMKGAIAKNTGENPDVQHWWAVFLNHAALPGVHVFNIVIPLGEFLVGLGLILGTFTTFAALMAMMLNTAFLFSGTVSTNGQMLILEMFLVVAAANAGTIGLDRWVLPFLRNLLHRNQASEVGTPTPSAPTHKVS